MKIINQWEPLVYRPELPTDWYCIEQRNIGRQSCQTGFVKEGKIHHNAKENRKFWVLFTEFQEGSFPFKYTVHAGNDIVKGSLKKFNDLKSAEAYLIYLMEEMDKILKERNSRKTINEYNKKLKKIKQMISNEENSYSNSFI